MHILFFVHIHLDDFASAASLPLANVTTSLFLLLPCVIDPGRLASQDVTWLSFAWGKKDSVTCIKSTLRTYFPGRLPFAAYSPQPQTSSPLPSFSPVQRILVVWPRRGHPVELLYGGEDGNGASSYRLTSVYVYGIKRLRQRGALRGGGKVFLMERLMMMRMDGWVTTSYRPASYPEALFPSHCTLFST